MTDTYDLDLSFWNWRLGGVLLVVAAVAHIAGQTALGQPIDPFAIGCALAVPVLWVRQRSRGVGVDG